MRWKYCLQTRLPAPGKLQDLCSDFRGLRIAQFACLLERWRPFTYGCIVALGICQRNRLLAGKSFPDQLGSGTASIRAAMQDVLPPHAISQGHCKRAPIPSFLQCLGSLLIGTWRAVQQVPTSPGQKVACMHSFVLIARPCQRLA